MKIDRKKVYEKYFGHCAYCGDHITLKNFNVDHFKSKFFGGSDDFQNLMPSCRSCNLWKTGSNIKEFREIIETQVEKAYKYSRNFRLASRFNLVKPTGNNVQFYYEKITPNVL